MLGSAFNWLGPLGSVSLVVVVAMSVCLCVCFSLAMEFISRPLIGPEITWSNPMHLIGPSPLKWLPSPSPDAIWIECALDWTCSGLDVFWIGRAPHWTRPGSETFRIRRVPDRTRSGSETFRIESVPNQRCSRLNAFRIGDVPHRTHSRLDAFRMDAFWIGRALDRTHTGSDWESLKKRSCFRSDT